MKVNTLKRFTCVVALIACFIPMLSVHAKNNEETPRVGYIYLGDSRFVGMNKFIHMDEMDDTFVVAKVGQGLSWLKKTAIKDINLIMATEKDIDEWVIITGLGVNDLGNIDKYIDYYDSLEDVTLILVSVNPVNKTKCDKYGYDYSGLSKGMQTFNKKLQETDYEYIDTYTELFDNGFSTVDGVHYTESTYIQIYDIIEEYLDSRSESDILDETKK